MKTRRLTALKAALSLCWRSSPWGMVLGTIGAIAQSALPLALLYLTKLLIDAIALGATATHPQTVWPRILSLVVWAGIVAASSEICQSLVALNQEILQEAVTDAVRQELHAKSLEIDLEYYENSEYYDKFYQAQLEAPYRPALLLSRLLQVLQGSISLGAIALLLFSLQWWVTLVLLVAVLPLLGARLRYAGQFYRQWQVWTAQERRGEYFSQVLTGDTHAKEVRLFDLGAYFQRRFQGIRRDLRQQKQRLAQRRTGVEVLTQILATGVIFTALGAIAYQTLWGTITLGGLVLYFQAFQRGQGILRDTARGIASLYEHSLFLLNFTAFLQLKSTVVDPVVPIAMSPKLQQGLCFEGVSFRYRHSQRWALQEVNLTIQAGETVAFVGENGAGKTTLVKLLCRLYDPTTGRITWDGVDLRQFAIADLRQQISAVFQDYARYDLSVKENIALSQTEVISQPRIVAAAESVGLTEAIAPLPAQYDTLLSTQFPQGEELSIGEWQKIAIARCFLRSASILILDEPTSALDPQAEANIIQHFRQLRRSCTTILIGHRLSTVKLADRIFVLDNGTIAESGTHSQLIQHQGIYARLFETQAQSYRTD
ncbi:MAG: ABC transporter ATP-binding protein [Jaaginema sp. PMC 1079.18]|nr:ABC transporter ATP-binding protein [Jaaginema sp. PMC 1080.18]MEC4852276.1 ABC transporter ATP-binding protein [Jaaginema sp. PMC 1079.18]MEC4867212.1 ABC transporter ATP-binding protein [Jaaginema sp. PMC 1078.18]